MKFLPLLVVLAGSSLALAQSSANRAATPPAPPSKKADLFDKILVMAGPSKPGNLTAGQRFHLYLMNTIGPGPLFGEAAGAAINQWSNSPKEWGQGWQAYGKRYGSNLAYNGVRQTIMYSASELFHEDNRYFGSTEHGFWKRTKHAVVSTFTARHPDGRTTFSISSTAGVIGAGSISTIWLPDSWKGVDNIAENAAISFGSTAAFNVVREFLPDILGRPRK